MSDLISVFARAASRNSFEVIRFVTAFAELSTAFANFHLSSRKLADEGRRAYTLGLPSLLMYKNVFWGTGRIPVSAIRKSVSENERRNGRVQTEQQPNDVWGNA